MNVKQENTATTDFTLLSTLKGLYTFLKPFKFYFVLVLLAGVFAAGFDMLTASLLAPLLNLIMQVPTPEAADEGTFDLSQLLSHFQGLSVIALCGLIAGVQVMREVTLYLSELISLNVRIKIDQHIRKDILALIMRTPFPTLEANGKSKVFTILNQYTAAIAIIAESTVQMILTGILVFAYCAMMIIISPWMTAILFVLLITISLIMNRLVFIQKKLGLEMAQNAIDLNKYGHETIHNIATIFLSNRQEQSQSFFKGIVKNLAALTWKSNALARLVGPLQRILSLLTLILAIYTFTTYINIGDDTFQREKIIMLLFILFRMNTPISQINTLRALLTARIPQANHLLEFTKETIAKEATKTKSVDFAPEEDIHFNDVSFKYNANGSNTINNVNLTLKKGQSTAIVGPSGSGKSTIIKLLGGLYEPNAGQISIGSVNLADVDIHQWRSHVAFVSQNQHLFTGTIAENIRFGCENASDQEVEEAAIAANAHEFIMQLPDKYEALVAEGGDNFSGGQKQRIQIARALCSKPRVLILDEPTSAQDALSENEVVNTIHSFGKDVTVVLITHRFSALSKIDQIYVMNDGEIVEQGAYKELMSHKSLYYQMHSLQTQHSIEVP